MPIVTTSSRSRPRKKTALPLAIAAIAVLAVIAYLVFREGPTSSGPQPEVASHKPQTKDRKTIVKPLSTLQAFNPSSNTVASALAAETTALPTNTYVKKPGQMMLPGGQVITFKPPKEGEVRIVHGLNGIKYECDSEGNWRDVTPKKLFDNPIENHLIGLSVENGSFIPAFMMGYDTNEVMKALHKDVVINADDSPAVVAKKEAVAEMKRVILDYIDQGGTYDGFISEMAEYVKSERKVKARALSKISKLLKEGKIEEACAYRDEINKVLDEQQYSTLKLPKFMSDVMGE